MSEASYSKRTPPIISGVQPKPFNNPPPPISGHPPKTAPAPPMSGEQGAAQFKQRGTPAVTNAGVPLTNNINNAVKQGARTTVVENPVTGRRVETLADLLWKLPQPCKPNTNEILEKCFKEFSQIVQINKNSTGEQAEYDKFISELTAKLEAEKTKIIEAKGSRRQVIQQNYDAKMRQLGQAKEAQLAAVKDNIYKNYDNLLEKHRNKYVPLISNIEKAYNYVNSICSEYGITHKKFPVIVNKFDIDINANPSQIALYAKTCAEAINELNSAETDSVKIINKLNSIDDTKKKLIGGGALIGAILAAPVALAGATALIAKQGLMEHQIGSKVKELSTDIMRCNLILKRMLAGMKEHEELDYPKKEPFDSEYERMYSSTLNSFKGEETKTTDIYLREIDGIKNEDISGQISALAANYDNEKSRIDSHFSNKIVNNGTIVSQRTRELFSVLNEYVQGQPTVPFKLLNGDSANLAKAAAEIEIANKKADLEKKILLFNNRRLFESLELKLVPDENTSMTKEFAYYEYNWELYNSLSKMRGEIDYIRKDLLANREYFENYQDNTDENIKSFLQKQLNEVNEAETLLYLLRTDRIILGDEYITDNVMNLPASMLKISNNKELIAPYRIRVGAQVNFHNDSVLCIYKGEEDMEIIANFVQSFVYNILYNHHTESIVVNVLNPSGNVLYDAIQIDRDIVSQKETELGKLIKGPDYVKASFTKTEVDDVYKRLEIADKTLAASARGRVFKDIVTEKRTAKGIIPKVNINLCIDIPMDSPFNRFLTGSDIKGILNIVVMHKDALIKRSYDQSKQKFKETISIEAINYARQFQTIVEVTEPVYVNAATGKNIRQSLLTVSNRLKVTQQKIIYDVESSESLQKMRLYLRERALATKKTSPETNEFIETVVVKPALAAREKERVTLQQQRDVLLKTKKSLALNPGVPENRLTPLQGDEYEFAVWYQNKIEAAFEKRCTDNPKGYCEMSFEETLPLYWGYVGGDRGNTRPIILDEISKPHLFVGGTTGGGKSNDLAVCVNTLKAAANPEDIEVVYFDFKVTEVALHAKPYKMPQCSAMCGTEESAYLISLLKYVDDEMMRRYALTSEWGVAKLSSLRKAQKKKKAGFQIRIDKIDFKLENKIKLKLTPEQIELLEEERRQLTEERDKVEVTPRMLFLVDEGAQAFQSEDDEVKAVVKRTFTRLAQLARAAGIHMCILSQDVDKFPSTIIDLIACRACTVAPPPISKNVLKNDFCARPENQFLGFFGVNCNNGNEADNIMYLVPYNDADGTTKVMSKVIDSVCKKLKYKSREAIVFSEKDVYTYDRHNDYMNKHQYLYNGTDVYIGEGVYFQKEFMPHKFSFRRDERNSLVIMSAEQETRDNLVEAVCASLWEHAVVIPCYAKEVPAGFGEDYFNRGLAKREDRFYAFYGKEVGDNFELTQKAMFTKAEQMFKGDVWDTWDDAHKDEYVKDMDGNDCLYCEGLCKTINEQSSLFSVVQGMIDSRKNILKKRLLEGNTNRKFTPYYFLVYDLSKHVYVRENAWSFWKELTAIVNEAAKYELNFIFVEGSTVYLDREIGGIYLVSRIESLGMVDKNIKGINPLFAKVYDIRKEYTAYIKVPVDGESERKKMKRAKDDLIEAINKGKERFTPEELQKYS